MAGERHKEFDKKCNDVEIDDEVGVQEYEDKRIGYYTSSNPEPMVIEVISITPALHRANSYKTRRINLGALRPLQILLGSSWPKASPRSISASGLITSISIS